MVEIVGAVDGQASRFSEHDILHTLDQPQELQHLATFTGRPATQLFVADNTVIKLRTDFVFQPKDVQRRALAALQEERRLQVHHPAKTWFYCDWNGQLVIGNIAPRLNPLHREMPEALAADRDQALAWFGALFSLYIETALNNDRRLDEGLSNFGSDENGKIYYLDDDFYPWDDYTSLALVLGVWIRQLEQVDEAFCEQLALVIAGTLMEKSGSIHAIHMLHGQLRNNLAVGERERACIATIMQVLSVCSRNGYKTARAAARQDQSAGEVVSNVVSLATTNNVPNAEPGVSRDLLTNITEQRFAVIADVHSNSSALQAVLNDIDANDIQQILVLGDLVGYGPDPAVCIDMLRQRDCLIVQGNHDYAASCGDTHRGFSKLATWSIEWTRENLDASYLDWLGALPPIHLQDDWMAVHGAPVDKSYFFAYVYHMTYQSNLDWLQEHKLATAFHGHSHLQMCYYRRGNIDDKNLEMQQDLNKNRGTLVCPGSVGQPRGGESRAEYAIYDSGTRQLEMKRVAYDISNTVEIMQRLQFPAQLYERLTVGA